MLNEPLMLGNKEEAENQYRFSTISPRKDLVKMKEGAGMPFYLRNIETEAFSLLWFVFERKEESKGQDVVIYGRDDNGIREVLVQLNKTDPNYDLVTVRNIQASA